MTSFLAQQRLEAGGAACISCHSMHDVAALGGGRLGPDLTNVYERLEGRKALSAWLVAPAPRRCSRSSRIIR